MRRYLRQWRETGSLATTPSPGRRPTIGEEQYPAVLAQVAALPDGTLAEHCAAWEAQTGVAVSRSQWCRLEQRVDGTRKKSHS